MKHIKVILSTLRLFLCQIVEIYERENNPTSGSRL
jgi:hypothetical protein